MILKSLHLRNVKSFVDETITFGEGMNGIFGMNGHGKTTIIEAIGYALYDSLLYSSSEFVRSGEKSGEITLTVEVDSNTYIIRRVAGQSVYELTLPSGERLSGAGQVKMVISKDILGLAPGDSSSDLWERMIGVSQGRLTSDFLGSPADRRRTFGQILGVEQYQEAALKLRDTERSVHEDVVSMEGKLLGLLQILQERDSVLDDIKLLEAHITKGDTKLLKANNSLVIYEGQLKDNKQQQTDIERLTRDGITHQMKIDQLDDSIRDLTEKESRLRDLQSKIKDGEQIVTEQKELLIEKERLEKDVYKQYTLNDERVKITAERDGLDAQEKRLSERMENCDKAEEEKLDLERSMSKIDAGNLRHSEICGMLSQHYTHRTKLDSAQMSGRNQMCPVLDDTPCPLKDGLRDCIRKEQETLAITIQELEEKKADINSTIMLYGDTKRRLDEVTSIVSMRDEFEQHRHKVYEDKLSLSERLRTITIELASIGDVEKQLEHIVSKLSPMEEQVRQHNIMVGEALTVAREVHALPQTIVKRDEVQEILKELKIKLGMLERSFDLGAMREIESKVRHYTEERGRLDGVLRQQRIQLEEKMKRKGLLDNTERDRIALEVELDKTRDLEAFITFTRKALKEAGPRIAEELRCRVTDVAGELYREVIGDFSQRLTWSQDYLITVGEKDSERPFQLLSGGEQMSAALSVRLALLRVVSHSDIVFLDEPTQNMDEERKQNLAAQISKMRELMGFRQIYVISHDDTFGADYETYIRLHKTDGVSRLCGVE